MYIDGYGLLMVCPTDIGVIQLSRSAAADDVGDDNTDQDSDDTFHDNSHSPAIFLPFRPQPHPKPRTLMLSFCVGPELM